jgi:tetratricopeptide (TPR) repeat protein
MMGIDQGRAMLMLASRAGDSGDYARFLRAIKMVDTLPRWGAATISMAAINYHLAGRSTEAGELFDTARNKEPDHPIVLRNYARYLRDTGHLEESLKCFGRSLEQAPKDEVAWSWLGATYVLIGDLDKARECYERCIREGFEGLGYGGLANVAARKGDLKEAVRQWREAVARLPRDEHAWYGLGNALARSEAYDEAIVSLRKSLALGKVYNADALYYLGYCYYMMGETVIAKGLNDRALALSPKDPAALELKQIIEEVLMKK